MFPYTGLAIMIMLPLSLIATLILISAYYFCVRNISFFQKHSWSIGVLTVLLVSVINIHLFPQEYRPPVWQQLSSYYQTYNQYHQLEYQDIYIPRMFPDFKHSKGKLENYVGALHKYRDNIPYDSTYSIYLSHERPGMKQQGEKDILKSEDDILNKLDTGAERLFYKILNWRFG